MFKKFVTTCLFPSLLVISGCQVEKELVEVYEGKSEIIAEISQNEDEGLYAANGAKSQLIIYQASKREVEKMSYSVEDMTLKINLNTLESEESHTYGYVVNLDVEPEFAYDSIQVLIDGKERPFDSVILGEYE